MPLYINQGETLYIPCVLRGRNVDQNADTLLAGDDVEHNTKENVVPANWTQSVVYP